MPLCDTSIVAIIGHVGQARRGGPHVRQAQLSELHAFRCQPDWGKIAPLPGTRAMECLDEETVVAMACGDLDGPALASAELHLTGCDRCRAVVAETAMALAREPPANDSGRGGGVWSRAVRAQLAPGATVSRYTIVELLGVGGAGTVYVAHDAQLRRRIALKLLPVDDSDPMAEQRWLREAQAMAQLAHPNVVAVYDAGLHEGHVFIALELVGGTTLGQHLAAERRGWREILRLFAEAGRGLAAAHAAGLVHRDFKPANVLIGDDGRVRVTDFGLARPLGAASEPGGTTAATAVGPGALELTMAGALVGTPAYMAPEQFAGGAVDARTDQFSFCVALYEALYRQRPHGDTGSGPHAIDRLAKHVLAGDVRAPPPDSDVPSWLFEIVRRGMAVDPESRHPSMDALLRALAPDFGPRRKARARAAAAAAAAVALVGGMAWLLTSARSRACGNGRVDPGEECDDGNRRDGDGCSAQCLACGGDGRSVIAESGHCYLRHPEPRSWADARAVCWAEGGHLVTYTSGYDMRAAFDALLAGAQQPHWTALVRREGKLVWDNGEVQPQNTLGIEWRADGDDAGECAAQVPAVTNGKLGLQGVWTARPCAQPAPFICEHSPWRVRPRGGHGYRVSWKPTSWKAARDECQARGAHLVTLADAEEEAFVRSLFGGRFWLGGSDATTPNRFAWITGEPFAYQNFAPHEPDRSTLNADCLAIDVDALWHDRSCDEPYPSVCEID